MLQVSFLLASFAGYFLLLYILFKGKKTALYPAVLVSGVTAASFGAGLLGCLQSMYGFIYIAGFVLLPLCICHLVKNREIFPRPRLSDLFPFAVLAVGAVVLYVLLKDRFIYGTDDFSHWGRVVRSITENLRLPIEADEYTHGSYPPGSGLFIAYVATVVEGTEGVWLFAHGLLLLSFLTAILAAGKNVVVQAVLACFIPFMMNYVNPLETLYVDTMLGVSALAGVVFCLLDDECSDNGNFVLALLLCPVVLMKNAGVFLAAVIAIVRLVRSLLVHRRFSWKLLALLLPFALLIGWNIYYGQHFTQVQRHQMSWGYYSQVFAEKSARDVDDIFRIILPRLTSFRENHVLTILPGYAAVLLVMLWQDKLKKYCRVFILAAALAVLYEAGVLLMYFFSMPMEEILIQNGDDFIRYNSSVTILLQGVLLCLVCRLDWPGIKKDSLRCAGAAATAAVCGMSVAFMQWDQHYPLHPVQYRVDNYAAAYQAFLLEDELKELPGDGAYIVYFSEPERFSGYNRNLIKYYFGGASVLRFFDEEKALAQRAQEPWRTYIDWKAGRIEQPVESMGGEFFTRTADARFTNVLNKVGFKENSRFSTTDMEDAIALGWDVTGYLPICRGDVIRLKNVTWYPSEENEARGGLYWFFADKMLRDAVKTETAADMADWVPVYDEDGHVVQITVPDNIGTTTAYLRIICQDINSKSIITINEEIP